MKKIIIKGKRNIDGIKGNKSNKRKVVEKNTNKNLFKQMSQIKWLNKLILKEKYHGITFAQKDL